MVVLSVPTLLVTVYQMARPWIPDALELELVGLSPAGTIALAFMGSLLLVVCMAYHDLHVKTQTLEGQVAAVGAARPAFHFRMMEDVRPTRPPAEEYPTQATWYRVEVTNISNVLATR